MDTRQMQRWIQVLAALQRGSRRSRDQDYPSQSHGLYLTMREDARVSFCKYVQKYQRKRNVRVERFDQESKS